VTEIDVLTRMFEPDVMDDPGPFFAWLRENRPVHRHRSGMYLVAGHADSQWVFQTAQLRGIEPGELAQRFPRMAQYLTFQRLTSSLAMMNPPRHTRVRRLVTREFTVKTVNSLLPVLGRTGDALLDQIAAPLRAGQAVDVHGEVTVPFALSAIFDLIGVDAADRLEMAPLVTTVLHATSPASTDEMMTAADAATKQIEEFSTALIEARRTQPRDDLISALVAVHDSDQDRLSHDDLMSTLWGVWAAGFETVAASMDNAIIALLRNPDQAHWLGGGQAEVRAFVNEALRYRSPTHLIGVTRIAVDDIELGGVTIPAGSDVRPLPGCANRDPAAFADPDRFDPARDTSATLTFGLGMHYCIGASLARAEGEVLLSRLHARFPGLALAGPPAYRGTPPVLACDRLDVALAH
jgi:cytochrome P450 family 114